MEEEKKDGRGGKREGAGRKAGVKVGAYKNFDGIRKKSICISISNTEYERLKEKAAENGVTMSRYLLATAGIAD